MVIRGGFGVGVMEGIRVMVGVREGVIVWSGVGDGVLVIGMFTTRVTSEVSTRVTSLVTSTVWRMGTISGEAGEGEQDAPTKISKKAVRPGTKNFNCFAPFPAKCYFSKMS
jgi:hypothetical protein